MAEARASLILEIVQRSEYLAGVEAASKATATLVAEQEKYAKIAPKATEGRKAESDAAKAQSKALKEVEKAYLSALAPHEKTALKLQQIQDLRFDDVDATTQQAIAVVHLSEKLEDQTRRFEKNRGSQNKLSRSLAELLEEQTKALLGADHLTAGFDRQTKRLDALEKGMTAVNIPGAGLIKTLKDSSDALKTLSESGSVAEVGMLKVGIAAGAVAAAGTALVVGVGAATGAIIANSAAADEWLVDLKKVGYTLDDVGVKKVNRAAAAIDTMGVAAKIVGVNIAETFAPSVEAGATQMVALGLAATDAWNALADGGTVIDAINRLLAEGLVGTLFLGVDALGTFGDVLGQLPGGGAFKAAGLAIRTFSGEIDEMREALVQSTEVGLREMTRLGLEPLNEVTGNYIDRARELISAQDRITHSVGETSDAIIELETNITLEMELLGALYDDIDKQGEDLYAGREERAKEAADVIIAQMAREAAAAKKAADERIALERQVTAARIDLMSAVGGAATAIAGLIQDESTAAYKALFFVAQGAALAGVTINTALGVTQALTLPPPADAIKAAAVITTGIGSAATILGATFGAFRAPTVSSTSGGGRGPTPTYGPAPASGLGTAGPDDPAADQTSAPVRKTDDSSLPVTDAYVGMGMGGMTLRPAEGDRLVRSGTLGATSLDSPRTLDELRGLRRDVQGLAAAMLDMATLMRMERHEQAARGGARKPS